MNFVIPMAGEGRRFVEAGYTLPKPLLPAHGKTLLEWSVDSLPLELASVIVFVGLKAHDAQWHYESKLRQMYAGLPLEFIWLDAPTRGQSESVLAAARFCAPDKPLLIYNIDTAFRASALPAALLAGDAGILGSFESVEARFSFAATDTNGMVVRVTEKEPISNHALTDSIILQTRLSSSKSHSKLSQEMIWFGANFTLLRFTMH